MTFRRQFISLPLIAVTLFLVSACGDNGYLLQSIKGHFDLMSRARSIDKILTDENEPVEVRQQLSNIVRLRAFAVDSLHLPDNGSYLKYADLQRPYAVWNMVAAPELSLDLNQWCFPVVGCVTYRGYFDETSAQAAANHLEIQGFDVDVYGVQAYSTLNWFDDPVLNTFLGRDEIQMASLLFHEMAHLIVYVPNDTVFNESFAKAVELEGLRRWFNKEDSQHLWQECQHREKLSIEFQRFLTGIRTELNRAYGLKVDNDQKRLQKRDILTRAYKDYEQLKQEWGDYDGFDPWMLKGLNNARLSSIANYYEYVPAFQELLRSVGYDLSEFYGEVKKISALTEHDRSARLLSLSPDLKASLQ